MALCEIRNFVNFLKDCLRQTVLEYKLKPLTNPGENYASVLQSVEVKVIKNDQIETLHLVVKTPISNPYLIELIKPALTFVKEARFYSSIVTAIQQFEDVCNVPYEERCDMFIRCLGSRISLDPSAKLADSDGVILMENAKRLGYSNKNRSIGFDAEETLAILSCMAKMHAIAIAMRRLQPKLFEEQIDPYLGAVSLIVDGDGTKYLDKSLEDLSFVDNIDSNLRIEIGKLFLNGFNHTGDTSRVPDSPYTTLVHRDLWINNIMIMRDETSNKTIKVKIYDLQLYFYHSFVCDLVLFLFTSVGCIDLVNDFKFFINHYHSVFVKTLELVNCPLEDYSFEKMWREIQDKAKLEVLHIFFLKKLCMVQTNEAPPSLDEVNAETFYKDDPPSVAVLNQWKLIINIFQENGFI